MRLPHGLAASLGERLRENEPLAPRNWFNLGGAARWFAECFTAEELTALYAWAREEDMPFRILGRGANLLVRDEGFNGLVVQFCGPLAAFTRDKNTGLVTTGAGTDLLRVVLECAKDGLAGTETLAGIPGTIGGAIRMNAGGKFGEIGSIIAGVRCLHKDGSLHWHEADECRFDYRHGSFPGLAVMEAKLRLTPGNPAETTARMKDCFAYKKSTQPALRASSAGCIFKNPTLNGERVSAGRLIDQAGLKGFRVGQAYVAHQHANFILADAQTGATACDVLAVITHVREVVKHVHNVDLELEVDVW